LRKPKALIDYYCRSLLTCKVHRILVELIGPNSQGFLLFLWQVQIVYPVGFAIVVVILAFIQVFLVCS